MPVVVLEAGATPAAAVAEAAGTVKIEDDAEDPRIIRTVRGVGYRLRAEARGGAGDPAARD